MNKELDSLNLQFVGQVLFYFSNFPFIQLFCQICQICSMKIGNSLFQTQFAEYYTCILSSFDKFKS